MPSLQSAARVGESQFQTDDGRDFIGTLFAPNENAGPATDFATTKTFLRVPPDSFITSGMTMLDAFGRRFLTTDYDLGQLSGQQLYKVFKVFYLNREVSWKRTITSTDTLTGLSSKTGYGPELGPIWVCLDMIQRQDVDLTMRIVEPRRRVITNADLKFDDKLDDMVVKRLERVLGVIYAEVQ